MAATEKFLLEMAELHFIRPKNEAQLKSRVYAHYVDQRGILPHSSSSSSYQPVAVHC